MFPLLCYKWHMRPGIYWLCNLGHITFGCWGQYIMFPVLFIGCLDVMECNPSESSDSYVWRLLTAPKSLKHYAWTTDRNHMYLNVPAACHLCEILMLFQCLLQFITRHAIAAQTSFPPIWHFCKDHKSGSVWHGTELPVQLGGEGNSLGSARTIWQPKPEAIT